MSRTSIEWVNLPGFVGESWNPVTGCSPASEGCANCYAARMARRLAGRCGYPAGDGFAVTVHRERFDEPLHWRKPRLVFVCSMGDLFHSRVGVRAIRKVLAVIREAKTHRFLVLTKRHVRMTRFAVDNQPWPENAWAGVSVESPYTQGRIRYLEFMPAGRRFVSFEPFLPMSREDIERGPLPQYSKYLATAEVNWVIIGGETGPGARAMDLDDARILVNSCRDLGIPVFVKQLGSAHGVAGDRRCADPANWPPELRVRQWPEGLTAQ